MSGTNEIRTVNETTGGEKGVKDERFDLIPAGPLRRIARHFGIGARKYADRNWERGYEWSKSYAALQRHLNAFWDGENIDVETDSPHLAAAGFHVLALLEFAETHPELDDRPSTAARKRQQEINVHSCPQLQPTPITAFLEANQRSRQVLWREMRDRIRASLEHQLRVGTVGITGNSSGPNLHFENGHRAPELEVGCIVDHAYNGKAFDGGTVVSLADEFGMVGVHWPELGSGTHFHDESLLRYVAPPPEPKYEVGERVSVRDVTKALDGNASVHVNVEDREGRTVLDDRVTLALDPEGNVTTVVAFLDALEEHGYQVTKA